MVDRQSLSPEDMPWTSLSQQICDDLLQIGLLRRVQGDADAPVQILDEDLFLFLPLLKTFELRLVPVQIEDCPIHFCTGILKHSPGQNLETAPQTVAIPAGGQGLTPVSAALGCLGEMSERLSLCSLGNCDHRIQHKTELQPEVGLSRILGLSGPQLNKIQGFDGAADRRLAGADLEWEDATERRVVLNRVGRDGCAQIPSPGVLFGETLMVNGADLSFASSAGCAVWHTKEGARERALLELVERDAVAQAWYNRLGITLLADEVQFHLLGEMLSGFLAERPRSTRIFRVATDLDVHVVMAVSFVKDGRAAAFGASADWTGADACQGAVTEMLQAEMSLELMERAYPASAETLPQTVPRQLAYTRTGNICDDLPMTTAGDADENEMAKIFSYSRLLESVASRGMEVWEFDATRQDLNIPCIKLFSPDLCSLEPRFGKKRLYNGVVERGLRKTAALETEFASRPFPF